MRVKGIVPRGVGGKGVMKVKGDNSTWGGKQGRNGSDFVMLFYIDISKRKSTGVPRQTPQPWIYQM